jgi:hypothetical protein
MAITYIARNYAAGTNWYAVGGSATTNPGNFLQEELNNFINAIGNPSSIRIEKQYSNHTSFTGVDTIRFLINTPEGGVGAAAGVFFGTHTVGTGAASNSVCYHTWTNTTSNNGAGSYTAYGTSHTTTGSLSATLGVRMMIAYDSGATLPWFVYGHKLADGSFLGGESLHRIDSSVIDTKIYAYVPKAGKWLRTTWSTTSGASFGNVATPNSTAPIEARGVNSSAESGGSDWGNNSSSRVIIQFPTTMHGNMGYLGRIEPDSIGIAGANTNLYPALADETVSMLGKTYTRFTQRSWVRTA